MKLNYGYNQPFTFNDNTKMLYMKDEIIMDKNKMTYIFPKCVEVIFDFLSNDTFEFDKLRDYFQTSKCY